MFFHHRNSQKRIYDPEGVYFITVVTHGRFQFFKERVFCETFVEELKICKRLKKFEIYGWVLMYDHFHILIKPSIEFNYSKIMKSLKENVSCSINRIMGEGATPASRLLEIYEDKYDIQRYIDEFSQKPKHETIHIPHFRWQKSYHDHLIRDENDLANHIQYIINNPTDADYSKSWPYIHTNSRFIDLTEPIDL